MAGPALTADRCVHARSAAASCDACVRACPRGAWRLDEAALWFDAAACDGCGLCAPACPEAAIDCGIAIALCTPLAFAACDETGLQAGPGRLPCVHAIGLRDLVRLRRQGVTELQTARGDCAACARGQATRVDTVAADLGAALADRTLTPIAVRDLSPIEWLETREHSVDAGPPVSRRSLLRRGVRTVVQTALGAVDGTCSVADLALPDPVGPAAARPARLPHVPVLAAPRCCGCDACVRSCPHGALAFDAEVECYRITPEACTGCQLCRDVCASDAVRIEAWSVPAERTLALQVARCRACGVPFHAPQGRLRGDGLCRVCRDVDHPRKLFQVWH